MTDRDNITLPREVVQEALEALAKTPCNSVYEQDCTPCNAEEALRKALAAEQPKHDLMKWAKDAGSSPEDLERFATYTIATRDMEIATLREENEALRRENERLREALELALNSHGRMLLSDPPQDAWKFNRVDEVIVAALRREEVQP